ncbi:MAG: carboxypeptidase-like regulatory domain-containing protein [Blastocatellia bacterium]|nr:carboxypeptidase-like regulatory domain-containing protein [Blastocatellia bacterium]
MSAISRVTSAVALLFCVAAFAHSQEMKEATGSVSGRITVKGEPLPGVTVVLMPSENRYQPQQFPSMKTKTDEEGRYRLTGLVAGQYMISAFAPTLVAPSDTLSQMVARQVNITDGEEIEGVDFDLIQGGVITGRVTDAQGRSLINQQVTLYQIGKQNRKRPIHLPSYYMFQTDDRGIYRLYGIPPGRYAVSVGEDLESNNVRMGGGRGIYQRTFHPDVTDESLARTIEIASGGEAEGVDISVGRPAKTHTASGRVIYVDTGKPVLNAICGYGPLSPDGKRVQGYGLGYRTDFEGNMRMEGLVPGRYAAFCRVEGQSDYYSEPTLFEVRDEDISGLEIKLHRGSSLSGVVVIEGTDDPAILARLQRLQISVSIQTSDLSAPTGDLLRIQSDGSFHLSGLNPGKARFFPSSYLPDQKGFHLVRVEHEGTDQSAGIEVKAGETVSGVRVVMMYGNARIRGQVKVEGDSPPATIRYRILFQRLDEPRQPSYNRAIETDDRGRFLIDGLIPGEYELTVHALSPVPMRPVMQNVTVNGNEDAEVTLTVNLSARGRDGQR